MKSSVENIDPTRVKLSVEAPYAELKPSIDAAYKEIAKQVSIPGFRRGKVPARIIDQRVGRPAVLQEAVNNSLDDLYRKAIDEHELRPLGSPEVEVTAIPGLDGTEEGDLTFTIEVDVRPEIELPAYDTLSVEVDTFEVSDEDVEKELTDLRSRFGTLKTVDRPAQKDDFVTLDLTATVDGEEIDSASDISYQVGAGTMLEGMDEALDGLSAEEETSFESTLAGGEHAGRTGLVAITLKAVKERELPEADDEFAQMASEFDTLEELRADLTEKVAEQAKAGLAGEIRDKVLEALLEATDVPTPDALVEAEAHQQLHSIFGDAAHDDDMINSMLAAEGTDRETFDAETLEATARAIRSQLLLDAVAEEASTDVSQEELTQHILFQAQRYGMDPNQFVQQIQQAGQLGSLFSDVRRSKALADVIQQVTVKDAEGNVVDTSEFFGTREDASDEDAADEATDSADESREDTDA